MSASAATPTTAENELKAKIANGLPSKVEGDLNGQTKLAEVADVWLAKIEQRQEHAPQTIEVYRDIVRRIILPAVGELRLSELTVGILDRFLKVEATRGYSRGRHARVVLAQIIELAVRRCDVDLDAGEPLVTITGTMVYVRGQGFLRQPHPKHSKYWRTVTVPSFTADALRERLAAAGGTPSRQSSTLGARRATWSPHLVVAGSGAGTSTDERR